MTNLRVICQGFPLINFKAPSGEKAQQGSGLQRFPGKKERKRVVPARSDFRGLTRFNSSYA